MSFPEFVGDQVVLVAGGKQYSQANEDVFYNWDPYLGNRSIQPDQSETGFVPFDLPTKRARDLSAKPNTLLVVDPADFARATETGREAKRAGAIRLWK